MIDKKHPIVIPDGPIWFCDVDDTLVMWGRPGHPEAIDITMDWGGGHVVTERLVPHKKHIELLHQASFRGQKVVVWSAGGSAWAYAVVCALGLEAVVDLVVSKPTWFIDDLTSSVFLPNTSRIYVNDYGKIIHPAGNIHQETNEDPDSES